MNCARFVIRSLLLTGEAFVLPIYDGMRVASLHVIPWSAITIPLIRLSLSEAPVVSYQLASAGVTLRNIPGRPPQLIHLRINPLPGFPPRGRSPVGLHADLAAVEVAGSEHTGRRVDPGSHGASCIDCRDRPCAPSRSGSGGRRS